MCGDRCETDNFRGNQTETNGESQTQKIHNNLAMIDSVFNFWNKICILDVSDLKQHIMDKEHKTKWAIHSRMIKMYQDLKKM